MSSNIYKVDSESIVEYITTVYGEDDYGSTTSWTKVVKTKPKEKDYGYYTFVNTVVIRLTPAMKLIDSYKFLHSIKSIVKATKVGSIGLGYLDLDSSINYDPNLKHFSELNTLDKFRFSENFNVNKHIILSSSNDYVFISLDGNFFRFKFSDLQGNIHNITSPNTNTFVYVSGKAEFK